MGKQLNQIGILKIQGVALGGLTSALVVEIRPPLMGLVYTSLTMQTRRRHI